MMKYCIVLLFFSSSLCAAPRYLDNLLGACFGKEEASEFYKNLAHRALKTCNIPRAEEYQVRRMSSTGQHLIGNGLCSFTPFGVWINEQELASYPSDEQYFILCQEAAHLHYKHHAQVYGFIPIVLTAAVKLAPLIRKQLANTNNSWVDRSLSCLIGYGLLSGIDLLLMRPWVKAQDKSADLYATDCLVKTDQQKIVDGHLAWLWAYIFQGYGLDDLQGWAPSYNEQYEYLSHHLKDVQQ